MQFGHEVQAGGKTKLEVINVRDDNNFMSKSHQLQLNCQGIQEGYHVLVDLNIIQLCGLVCNILESQIHQFLQGFDLDITILPIRSIPGWVDLTAHHDPMSAFYYKKCHVLDKKGIPLFKKPRSPFTLALVMMVDLWEDFQMYLER